MALGWSPRDSREMVLRDERAVIPVGCYNPTFGVTLSLPSVIGREGVHRVLEPEMSDAERQGLQRSAEAIKAALSRSASTNLSGEQLRLK
jgi:L-lactate dehydrogenase